MAVVREFRCLVQDDQTSFKVAIDIDNDIDDLKETIRRKCEHGCLRTVDAKDLVLWKVNCPDVRHNRLQLAYVL